VIRTLVQFTEAQWEDARELARSEGRSLASFVRQAVDEQLAGAESLRSGVRRRALHAIDSLEVHDRDWGNQPGRHGGQAASEERGRTEREMSRGSASGGSASGGSASAGSTPAGSTPAGPAPAGSARGEIVPGSPESGASSAAAGPYPKYMDDYYSDYMDNG